MNGDAASRVDVYLAVGGGRAQEVVTWYGRIFGTTVNRETDIEGDHIGHAELQIGAGVIYISDEAAALGAGAHTAREPYDGYRQRNAWMVDPFGHRWGLNSPTRARVMLAADVHAA